MIEKPKADLIITNLTSVVTYPDKYMGKGTKPSWKIEEKPHSAIAAYQGVITWMGNACDIFDSVSPCNSKLVEGYDTIAVPGFIDSHTHIVYAGNRADEFEMRVQGKTYLEIMAAGGGILNTTNLVRKLNEYDLLHETEPRVRQAISLGTTTLEMKTGYGLDLENELKMLRVIKHLANKYPIKIVPTFMGAHAIPANRLNDVDSFVDEICEEWIPAVAELGFAKFNDVFTEQKAFSVEQSRKILNAGKKYGLMPKIHADEISELGGVDLAVEVGAVSADHLLVTGEKGIEKLRGSGVIPTVLPGTSTYLMENKHAAARQMIDAGLPVAVASDHNPGSCQFLGMNLIQSLAMLNLKMSADEALIAATHHAAHALGLGDETGSLEVGKRADILLIRAKNYKEIGYRAGIDLCDTIIANGKVVDLRQIR